MDRQVDSSIGSLQRFRALAESPAYLKYADTTERIAKAHELAGARLRNSVMAQQLNDGYAVRAMRASQEIQQRRENMEARARNQALRQGLNDGSAVAQKRTADRL